MVDIGLGLRGPVGTQVALSATGLPSVSALAFDDAGRMWATTADFNDSGHDALYVVSAAGTPPAKVVSDLHTPMGLAWHDNTLYVSSRSGIDAYSNFDGTRFARQRTVLKLPSEVGTPGGVVMSPDGRLIMGVSAPCDSCRPNSDRAGAVLSIQPGGSEAEVFAAHIRAPVGLAYLPGTDRLFVTMNQRDDLGDRTPGDWLAMVRRGDDWRFPERYGQSDQRCAGAPKPVAVLDKHAAASGVAFVAGSGTTSDTPAAVVAEWATGRLLRIDLTPTQSGYAGIARTYVDGLKNPVPVVVHDGALFVGEWTTGNVYRLSA